MSRLPPRGRRARGAAERRGPATVSAVYEGVVTHRRHTPVAHAFSARLYLLYVDLAELPELFDGVPLWSARRAAPAWWRRADYLGDPALPLDEAVRRLVHERSGTRPEGPVRMLAQVRTWGIGFNPVAFYWCFDASGERVEAVVAEVTNTPWGERHAYVATTGASGGSGNAVVDDQAGAPLGGASAVAAVDASAAAPLGREPRVDTLVSRQPKALHLSPLMAMDVDYVWRIIPPGERIEVSIASERPDGEVVFDAGLSLRRHEIGRATLPMLLARFPLMTARVLGRIYSEAVRARLKGVPWHAKPVTDAARG